MNQKAYLIETCSNSSPRDPDVIFYKGNYYHTLAYKNAIYIKKSPTIKGLLKAEKKCVYVPIAPFNKEVWAPELHIIDDKCYIYVAIDDGNNYHHRMFVLSNDSSDPLTPFNSIRKISDKTDKWAIDGTVIKYQGELYFAWAGWEGDLNIRQNIYIAHMKNPFEIDSERVLIATPTYEWEKNDCDGIENSRPYVNEGPFALYLDKYLYIIYSASGCWGNNYCLGALRIKNGEDILNKDNWTKLKKPLLARKGNVNAPGHASFIQNAPDGKIYMAYHAFNGDCSKQNENTFAVVQEISVKDDLPILGEPIYPYEE